MRDEFSSNFLNPTVSELKDDWRRMWMEFPSGDQRWKTCFSLMECTALSTDFWIINTLLLRIDTSYFRSLFGFVYEVLISLWKPLSLCCIQKLLMGGFPMATCQ